VRAANCETYDYNPATSLLKSQQVRRSGYITPLLSLGYGYYPSGQLKQLTEVKQPAELNETLTYDYDALARLSDVKGSGPDTWSETYAYDSYGNRLGVSTLMASGKPLSLIKKKRATLLWIGSALSLLTINSLKAGCCKGMGKNSAIQWCDHTFNPWLGCTKFHPAVQFVTPNT
jgi:hypothetical protein